MYFIIYKNRNSTRNMLLLSWQPTVTYVTQWNRWWNRSDWGKTIFYINCASSWPVITKRKWPTFLFLKFNYFWFMISKQVKNQLAHWHMKKNYLKKVNNRPIDRTRKSDWLINSLKGLRHDMSSKFIFFFSVFNV